MCSGADNNSVFKWSATNAGAISTCANGFDCPREYDYGP